MLSFSLNGALNALVNLGAGQTMKKIPLGTITVSKVRVQKFIRRHSLIVPKTVVFYKSEIIPCYRKLSLFVAKEKGKPFHFNCPDPNP